MVLAITWTRKVVYGMQDRSIPHLTHPQQSHPRQATARGSLFLKNVNQLEWCRTSPGRVKLHAVCSRLLAHISRNIIHVMFRWTSCRFCFFTPLPKQISLILGCPRRQGPSRLKYRPEGFHKRVICLTLFFLGFPLPFWFKRNS